FHQRRYGLDYGLITHLVTSRFIAIKRASISAHPLNELFQILIYHSLPVLTSLVTIDLFKAPNFSPSY
ncbi:MAG: hypothetical protein ACLUCR_08175, partial [Limosilactobacillus fermentum]